MPSWCPFLSLPGTAFILVVAGQKRRRLQKTLLLQMIKNSQVEGKPTNLLQVIVMLPTADQFEAKHGLTWPAWVVSSRIAILRTIRL
jgi:hypothetical protein